MISIIPQISYKIIELIFLTYFFTYYSLNLFFIILAFYEVRRRIVGRAFEDLDLIKKSPFTPPVSIIIPAYNEEITIVESLKSLIKLEYPRTEIVIVSDGSNDATIEVLKRAFNMKRIDIDYSERIRTAHVRGYYESKNELPEHIIRFVLIDKDNGGRADAVNAGINASLCPYFVSIDADSVLEKKALLQSFRLVLDNKDIVAIGGQVAVLNGCVVREGKIVLQRIPESRIAKFQMIEYIRSFTMGRTAFARLDSLIIISGTFGIFQKEFVLKVGGYLTKYITSKVAREYTSPKAETICEDIELVTRLHRYIKEKKLKKKIAYVPHPLCWTEVPERLGGLSNQRNRWQRGLMETMFYHRKMLFNRTYGRIGFLAFPYFLVFELLAAPIELFGYLSFPILFFLDSFNYSYMIMFFIVSIVYGIFISVLSVVISAWPLKATDTNNTGTSLVYYKDFKEIVIIILYGILENFGYRQLTIWWRMKGVISYLKGAKGWGKIERKGFGENAETTSI